MSTRTPRTYDEITARTVPDPDSSIRPTAEQRRAAMERVPPPRDEALASKVYEALRDVGAEQIGLEVEGALVILRGGVADVRTWNRIEDVVRGVDGVEEIDNRMHVVARG